MEAASYGGGAFVLDSLSSCNLVMDEVGEVKHIYYEDIYTIKIGDA
jgi:hypothetical protein